MKVYFSANHRYLERDLTLYREIISALQSEGHILVNGWVEVANNKWPQQKRYDDWTSICIDSRIGVNDADIVIAEASGETGFGVGFEVAYALSKGKKVAILIQKDQVSNSYASGLDPAEVSVYEYSRDTVAADIHKLLRSMEKK